VEHRLVHQAGLAPSEPLMGHVAQAPVVTSVKVQRYQMSLLRAKLIFAMAQNVHQQVESMESTLSLGIVQIGSMLDWGQLFHQFVRKLRVDFVFVLVLLLVLFVNDKLFAELNDTVVALLDFLPRSDRNQAIPPTNHWAEKVIAVNLTGSYKPK
jgi:hypothetical protein